LDKRSYTIRTIRDTGQVQTAGNVKQRARYRSSIHPRCLKDQDNQSKKWEAFLEGASLFLVHHLDISRLILYVGVRPNHVSTRTLTEFLLHAIWQTQAITDISRIPLVL